MITWAEFSSRRPDLASMGRAMFYQHGLGLGFLATVRRDGGPRVHPICPILSDTELYALIVPGPKLDDLRRDGRYALSCETFAPPRHDDGYYLSGRAAAVADPEIWDRVAAQVLAERDLKEPWPGFDKQVLFELLIETCLLTLTQPDGDLPAGHTIWHA
jgi:hypothetical protein